MDCVGTQSVLNFPPHVVNAGTYTTPALRPASSLDMHLNMSCVAMQNTSTRATIRYGTGSVALNLVYEETSFGGIPIQRQGVGLATALTSDFVDVSCDGLVVRNQRPPTT